MWLPVSALSTYNQNVLVNYNEQLLGANCNSRFCKTKFIDFFSNLDSSTNSNLSNLELSLSTSNSSSSSIKHKNFKTKENCPPLKMSTTNIKSVQNSNHEAEKDLQNNQINSLDISENKSESSKLDNKSEDKSLTDSNKILDKKTEAKAVENKLDTKPNSSKLETNKTDKGDKSVDKYESASTKTCESNVDVNNNLCDKTILLKDDNVNKLDVRALNKDSEKIKNKEKETMSSNNNSTNNNTSSYSKPHQCSVATSYHVYSNGCAISNSNKRGTNKNSSQNDNLLTMNNSTQQTNYTPQHALNQPTAHISAAPYTIYTTGHYSLNGQPTILSIPQNATISHLQSTSTGTAIVNQATINQPTINQSPSQINQQPHTHHLHHNHYHHSNQAHNNHSPHLHYHHQANIQQNYHHSSNFQNSQKNLVKNNNNNNNSIKTSSLSSSNITQTASSLTSSTVINNSSAINSNNNISTKSSSIIYNSSYSPSNYTNSNSPSSPISNNSTTQTGGNQFSNQNKNVNLNIVNESGALHHYHQSGYYNGILNQNIFRKIFVGGLPYSSTDKTLSKFFQAFGEIEEAVVIVDRQTGKSRGYGFCTNLYSLRPNPTGYSPPVISTNSQYSLAPTAYMYSNGLLLSTQAPTMIAGYPTNAPCAYFDYASFADPAHLTALSPLNGATYATQTTGPLTNHHTQAANNSNAQPSYASPPDGNQPTIFAPISTDLTGQVYGFAPIQHRF